MRIPSSALRAPDGRWPPDHGMSLSPPHQEAAGSAEASGCSAGVPGSTPVEQLRWVAEAVLAGSGGGGCSSEGGLLERQPQQELHQVASEEEKEDSPTAAATLPEVPEARVTVCLEMTRGGGPQEQAAPETPPAAAPSAGCGDVTLTDGQETAAAAAATSCCKSADPDNDVDASDGSANVDSDDCLNAVD